ncbi:MAG: LacI family DNA-binding transcriptional regulator [Verrucomicrobiota bacterium]
MASLKDVASEVGVSIAAASIILNSPHKANRFSNKCIQEVQEAAKRLNYYRNHRAGSLRAGKSKVLGILVHMDETQGVVLDPSWSTLISGIDATARASGYETLMVRGESAEQVLESGIRFYRERRIDGLVVPVIPKVEDLEILHQFEGPLVIFNRPGISQLSNVSIDESEGVRMALEHLNGLGHKNILWVGPENWGRLASNRRAEAFIRLTGEMGLDASMCQFSFPEERKSSESIIARVRDVMANHIKEGHHFTSIISYDEHVARGVYEALVNANKKIPEDVSVVSFGDYYSSFFMPALTTIKLPIFEAAGEAARILLEMIQAVGDGSEKKMEYKMMVPGLMVRESSMYNVNSVAKTSMPNETESQESPVSISE